MNMAAAVEVSVAKSKVGDKRRRLGKIKVDEVSIVDDPAVPAARYVIVKRRVNKAESPAGVAIAAESKPVPEGLDVADPKLLAMVKLAADYSAGKLFAAGEIAGKSRDEVRNGEALAEAKSHLASDGGDFVGLGGFAPGNQQHVDMVTDMVADAIVDKLGEMLKAAAGETEKAKCSPMDKAMGDMPGDLMAGVVSPDAAAGGSEGGSDDAVDSLVEEMADEADPDRVGKQFASAIQCLRSVADSLDEGGLNVLGTLISYARYRFMPRNCGDSGTDAASPAVIAELTKSNTEDAAPDVATELSLLRARLDVMAEAAEFAAPVVEKAAPAPADPAAIPLPMRTRTAPPQAEAVAKSAESEEADVLLAALNRASSSFESVLKRTEQLAGMVEKARGKVA